MQVSTKIKDDTAVKSELLGYKGAQKREGGDRERTEEVARVLAPCSFNTILFRKKMYKEYISQSNILP